MIPLPSRHFSVVLILTLAAGSAWGGASDLLTDASAALNEGVPQVAIVKLQQQLADASKLEPGDRRLVKARLAEAFLVAGRATDALGLIHDPDLKEPMLEARIDAATGRWKEALAIYSAPAAPGQPQTVISRAECLWQLGRLSDAVTTLENAGAEAPAAVQLRLAEFYLEQNSLKACSRLLQGIKPHTLAEQKWKQYVEARLYLEQGYPAYAYGRFEEILRDPRQLTENLVAGSALGMTQARAELSGLADADDILEQFIWKYPESPHLDTVFRKLDEVYAGEENASKSELEKWSGRNEVQRAGYAEYYLAKLLLREGKEEQALNTLQGFSVRFPRHSILADALLMQGRLLANQKSFALAQNTLEAAMRAAANDKGRANIEMASATAHFQAREFVLAATEFRDAAEQSPALWQRGIANSALSWLHQGNYSRFTEVCNELCRRLPASPMRGELMLEEGLFRASQSDPMAEATLKRFIHDFPGDLQASEATLALAELRFEKDDAAGASQYLQAVNEGPAPSETVEQSAYLAIFVADSSVPRVDEKVITLCQAFLEHYQASPHLSDVRMKLGQLFFRKGDFASAQTQFQALAHETAAGSPLVESALFLAGQCAMKRMNTGEIDQAIELFEEVARLNGPLKLHARLQQAVAQNRLGKADEAIKLYDVILRESPSAEVKFAALAGKAGNLFEMGAKEKNDYEQALAVYEELAFAPGVTAIFRNQALYQKGRCLEALSRKEEALAAYYDVLQAGVAKPEEYFWFYKAGFDAGRLCEEAARLAESPEQWKSAISIYQKMAALDGPRAEEAKSRRDELRLKHFIWE